ncbi:hypothetical protein VTN02DRAFT_6069 [Thermoascus thermophilus]
MENTLSPTPGNPSGAFPSPPLSPRKRRMMLRESEETTGSMSIEEYLVRSDPFRSTTIRSPLPYPLKLSPAPEDLKVRVERLYPDINSFLRSRQISRSALSFVNVSKPGYPGGDMPVATLHIKIYDEGIAGFFGQIKDEAKRILSMHGLQQIPVEVCNPERCFQPSLFAIHPDDPTVTVYRHIRDDLAQALHDAIGTGWQAMCLFLVGLTEDTANPAIVVTVQPATICDWARLEGVVNSQLIRYKPREMTINIEFLPGYCQDLPPRENTSRAGESFAERLADDCHPEMGCSIGVSGEHGGGTLGGFVRLQVGDKIHKGFMTNYHVISPPRQAGADIQQQADRYGSFYHDSTSNTRTDVHYLAVDDIEPTKKDLERSIKDMVHDIEKWQEEQRNREIAQMRPRLYLQREIEWAQGMVTTYRKKLDELNAMPIQLGRVLISSGKSVDGKNILDWAFVELSEPQGERFFRANPMPQVDLGQFPRVYQGEEATTYNRAGRDVCGFGEMRPGEWYLKCGRSSNVTVGICNGVEQYCNWTDADRLRYDVNGNEITISKGYTEEYVIVSKRQGLAAHMQSSFCKPGDSGSFVIDRKGNICGLLYGQVTGWCGPADSDPGSLYIGAGLVSCMSKVQASMLQKLTRPDMSADTSVPSVSVSLEVPTTGDTEHGS